MLLPYYHCKLHSLSISPRRSTNTNNPPNWVITCSKVKHQTFIMVEGAEDVIWVNCSFRLVSPSVLIHSLKAPTQLIVCLRAERLLRNFTHISLHLRGLWYLRSSSLSWTSVCLKRFWGTRWVCSDWTHEASDWAGLTEQVWLSGLNCVWLKVCSETTALLADALAVLVSPGLLWGPWREPGLYSFLLWYHNKWSSPGLDRHHRHYPQHNAHCCF